jgi:hypothetical protein
MKTVQEYMNDPRITEDPGLMASPKEIRTIHAIRLKQHDETAGMSFEEKTEFHRKRTDAMFASLGLPLPEYVNLSGQGKPL